jgi:hypothetical protein
MVSCILARKLTSPHLFGSPRQVGRSTMSIGTMDRDTYVEVVVVVLTVSVVVVVVIMMSVVGTSRVVVEGSVTSSVVDVVVDVTVVVEVVVVV